LEDNAANKSINRDEYLRYKTKVAKKDVKERKQSTVT